MIVATENVINTAESTSLMCALFTRASVLSGFAAGQAAFYFPIIERPLTSPPQKLEIRTDFPQIQLINYVSLMKVIEDELAKQGVKITEAKRINIVHSWKHPEDHSDHYNGGKDIVESIKREMSRMAPNVDWIAANSICETKKLERSFCQSSIKALAEHQVFEIYESAQKDPFPFILEGHTEQEYFIIVDHAVEQGTTFSNLMSYITHNGGVVLAVATDYIMKGPSLVQQKTKECPDIELLAPFNDSTRNTARLPELAEVFAESTKSEGVNYTPQECMVLFEEHLQLVGNSVFAMTDGECRRLIDTIEGKRGEKENQTFLQFLDSLSEAVPAPTIH